MNATIKRELDKATVDRDRTLTALRQRGVSPVETITVPPSDDELRADYWYWAGWVDGLAELIEELAEDERAA